MVREILVQDGSNASRTRALTPPVSMSASATKRRPKPKPKKVAVFIDGSNLYFKLRTLIPSKMDFIRYRYRDLASSMIGQGEKLSYVGYYVGVVRDTKRTRDHEKTLDLLRNQQKLFEQLRHQGIDIVKGYLLERDGKYFEKGVDVRLAVDIVTMAQARAFDIGVVISSDTDLIPAIQTAQKLKREIVYVGFEHQPSLALIRQADRARLVTRAEAEALTTIQLAVNRFDQQEDA